MSVARNAGLTDTIGAIYSNLGNLANRKGEVARAAAYLGDALNLNLTMNDPRQIAVVLERFAAVAVTEGRMERAARLLGAAHRIRTRLGAIAATAEREEAEKTASVSQRALGASVWAELFGEGAALSLEEAVAYALGENDEAVQQAIGDRALQPSSIERATHPVGRTRRVASRPVGDSADEPSSCPPSGI